MPAKIKKNSDQTKMNENNTSERRVKPRGLVGLYKEKMFLNGTSNEVFDLGL